MRADSIDFDFDKTIDRLQKAKKADFEDSIFEAARMKIASHHAKYAREENRLPDLPDDAITAQFLAVAEWPRLEALALTILPPSAKKPATRTAGTSPSPCSGYTACRRRACAKCERDSKLPRGRI